MKLRRVRWQSLALLVLFVLSLFGTTGATSLPLAATVDDPIQVYFFYSPTCPHCHAENEVLLAWEQQFADLEVTRYNITETTNYDLLQTVASVFSESLVAVPFTVVGGKHYVGYSDSIRLRLQATIRRYRVDPYVDVMAKILQDEPILPSDFDLSDDNLLSLPLLGEVDVRQVSLLLAGAAIGLVDGFNPCAMWVLLFLIGLLLGSKDRKKMWWLGLTFLVTSAAVYFVIMRTWIGTVQLLGAASWLPMLIGGFAIGAGIWSFYRYHQQRQKDIGCTVTSEPKRKRIMSTIRTLVQEKPLLLALPGIVALAISVNIIELACSAGLPLLYSELLIVNGISGAASVGYLLWYLLFFLLDDLLIFSIAMITMRLTAFSNRYVRYAHLVGGAIMVVIGLSLVFFPELIMFGW